MSVTSIGIQSISGRTGTAQQPVQEPPANDNDTGREKAAADDASDSKQSPPPPGMGKYVDKTI